MLPLVSLYLFIIDHTTTNSATTTTAGSNSTSSVSIASNISTTAIEYPLDDQGWFTSLFPLLSAFIFSTSPEQDGRKNVSAGVIKAITSFIFPLLTDSSSIRSSSSSCHIAQCDAVLPLPLAAAIGCLVCALIIICSNLLVPWATGVLVFDRGSPPVSWSSKPLFILAPVLLFDCVFVLPNFVLSSYGSFSNSPFIVVPSNSVPSDTFHYPLSSSTTNSSTSIMTNSTIDDSIHDHSVYSSSPMEGLLSELETESDFINSQRSSERSFISIFLSSQYSSSSDSIASLLHGSMNRGSAVIELLLLQQFHSLLVLFVLCNVFVALCVVSLVMNHLYLKSLYQQWTRRHVLIDIVQIQTTQMSTLRNIHKRLLQLHFNESCTEDFMWFLSQMMIHRGSNIRTILQDVGLPVYDPRPAAKAAWKLAVSAALKESRRTAALEINVRRSQHVKNNKLTLRCYHRRHHHHFVVTQEQTVRLEVYNDICDIVSEMVDHTPRLQFPLDSIGPL
eukprot:GHVQ01015745.1.p1 GENE.GHVQ01015745.1~~GHVQ01015745.1.p1  ORF type:complete len:591 (-),score=84.41 GHVQ01015745.1:463-1974(-)